MEDRPSDLAEGRRCLLCDEEFFVFMMERLRSVSSTVELLGKGKCDPITEETEKRLGRWGGGEQSLRKFEQQSLEALQGTGAGTFGTGLNDTLVRMSVGVS